jgi:sterol desaturase/sphingolipid hydroxylase (fatty acid hydroxylase superfamily)
MPSVSIQIIIGFPLVALVFRILERCCPRTPQRLLRRGWKVDVAYYALGCVLGKFSGAGSLAAMLFLRHVSGMDFGRLAARQPGWLQLVEIVLLSDFLGYLVHRALHSTPWLWRFHRVHHSSRQMDWLASARLHPVDKLLGDFVQLTPLLCLGFDDGPLLIYAALLGMQMFFNHANVRVDLGPLRWLVAGPDFHHWHHCDEPAAYNKNFSPHLVIFDRLFGSTHLPDHDKRPSRYGVREKMAEGFLQQMIEPFGETLRAAGLGRKSHASLPSHWTMVQLRRARASYEIRAALLFALLARRRLTNS